MRKIIFILAFALMGSFAFASNEAKENNELEINLTIENNQVNNDGEVLQLKNDVCRVSCSVTIYNPDGTSQTLETSAGWFLTSCETAAQRCEDKLNDILN